MGENQNQEEMLFILCALFFTLSYGVGGTAEIVIPCFNLPEGRVPPCQYLTNVSTTYLSEEGLALLEMQNGEACRYPYPTNLGFEMECVQEQGLNAWKAKDPALRDIYLPNDILADFCFSNFIVEGTLLVPPSTNVSLWRPLDGVAEFEGQPAGIVSAGETIYFYGYLQIATDTTQFPQPPADNTLFRDFFIANEFDLANRTQFWNSNCCLESLNITTNVTTNGTWSLQSEIVQETVCKKTPGFRCQTLLQTWEITTNMTNLTGVVGSLSYQINLNVFDQCVWDVTLFVGIVAGVGGAIIAATVIYALVSVILLVKESKEEHAKGSVEL